MDKIPRDIIYIIELKAAYEIVNQLSDLILGQGIGNQSLSTDGVSQSLSSATFERRLKEWEVKITAGIQRVRRYYKGINMRV